MDKNFIQFQANAYKNLVELFNYKFTSEGKEFNLIDFVKSQILNKTYIPVASEIIAEKDNNAWLKQRISIEYFDILKNADNFDVVCDKFVELYNTYLLYKDEKEIVTSVFYYSELEFILRENDIDAEKIGFLYNPVLKKSIIQDSIEFKEQDYSRYRSLAQSFSKTLTFNDTFKEKGKNIVVLSESNKTILLNQSGVKGVIPLESNFLFNPQDTNKQIEVNLTQYVDSGYDYTKEIDNIDNITENNKLFNELLQIKDSVKTKFNSKFGSYYIDKINKENLLQSDYKFYILSSIKDSKDKFVNASVNLIFNKERTISAVLNAYDFYYAVNIFQRFDTDVTFDIFYDNENESVVFVGNRTQFVKVPVGFNQVTSTIEYANKEVSFILTLPTQKDYGNVIKDVWLYSFSLSTTLKEIIEFTKEGEDIQKIRIPSDFLNQKDIIQKEQLFKIETVEEKLNNVKLTGKDFLDRIVQYAEEYVLTYSQKTFKTVKADDGTMKTVFESFEPVTTDKRFFIQGTQPNTDYVWKVNEIFWRYNKNISIREMIAYFVSKGDDYHYRLLSYRILGIDCYLLKEKLEEQLIKEMLVCVEDFAINVRNKTIDKPLKITYKYEYATGNYYQKRQKLRPSDVDSLEVYPMRESIMLYYGEDLGENIIQNQISFLENELIKPKEMTWNSKSEQTKLYSHPLDPIFANDNYIKKKNSYSSNLIVTEFHNFIRSTNLVNTQLSKDDIKFAYTLRLPESISIPLQFIKEFNCFKVSILPKESDKNKKGADVFAVFGQNDTKNENPLFIGDDSVNSQSCKDWINSKPYNGSIKLNRKYAKNGDSLGTYAFTKKLDRLTDDSFDNLYEGGFISVDERDNQEVEPANKKIIVNEVLIAFNTKQPKAIIEGDIQFNNFMKNYVDDIDALKFQKIWNETYNYIMYPKKMDNVEGYDVVMKLDNSKFPIFIEHSRFFKDKLSNEFMLNDNQIDGIKFHIGNSSSSLLAHEVGFGKCQPLDSKLLTPKGWLRMGDIEIGDDVISVDGLPTKVLGIYPQGEKDIYKITFDDGAVVECCDEHLWSVIDTTRKSRSQEYITLSLKQIMDDKLQLSIKGSGNNSNRLYKFKTHYKDSSDRNRWQIPVVEPIHFEKQELPIHPYLLGALIGDGSLSDGALGFSSADEEMIDKLKLILPNNELRIKKRGNSKYDYIISRPNFNKKNELNQFIKELNLKGKTSDNKFIPEIYKFNSVENRISLLQGLMDTDGTSKTVMKKGVAVNSASLSYCTVSKELCDDVVFLIRSLGGIATIYKKKSSYTYKGEKKKGKLAYVINISLPPSIMPFSLTRKIEKHIPKYKYKPSRFISNVEYVGKKEAQCIKVDHPSHLYVTDDFAVTHNTTTSICSISHNFLTGKAKRTLISVPNPTYVNWITEIKGQSLSNGKSLKGLLPQINVVELGNARKDIFLRYDAKTFTQTGGIKKYTRSQIQNIHNFKDVTSFVNSQIKRVGNIYFSDYSDKKENVEAFLKFVEKTFDEKLSDWRTESFFTDYFNEIRTASSNYNSKFRTDLSEIENDEDNTIQRINDNSRINAAEKSSQENKAREKFEKKKNKLFEASIKNFTNQVISIINSKSTSIFDFIGVYDECFLKNYTVIISTHQAIGQLRIDKDTAIDVARELKDEQPIRLSEGGLSTSEFGSSLLKNAIGFDKLNIDSIIVDEVHNFNELFAYTKKQISALLPATRRKTYYLANDYPFEALSDTGSPYYTKKGRGSNLSSIIKFNVQGKKTSSIKSTLYGIAKKLQKNKENVNIMLLSATPFVDNLYQMIGVFNLLRNFQQPITFFSNYLYQEWDWENDQRGNTVLKVQTSNFKNHEARNNWIKMFSQFYTFDKRISEQRPQKFIYPFDSKNQSNQYEDNCNTNVYLDFSPEQFNIYKNLGKYVDGSLAYGNIVPSVKPTTKITKEVYINPDDIKDVKDYINPTSDYYDLEQASQVFIMNNWIDVLNDKSNPFQKDIIDIYDVIKDEIDRLSSEEEEGKSLTDGEEEVVDVNDSDQYQGIGMDTQGTRALRGQDIGKKLALSPYMVTPEGAEDEGTINPDLPPLYGMNTPDNLINSAINFVETSPKIYFVVKSIECLIKKQQENNEDITGQIIYMTIGQNFWYGGVKYNGMELIKAYLKNSLGFNNKFVAEEIEELASSSSTKCGTISDVEFKTESKIKKYDLDEVQILSGQSQDALKKNAIAKSFNDGRIKILIGSSTIKEGINLQGSGTHGNSTIYILTADYAPMDFMQLEGRIWRQGNPLENVRIVYTLIKNSIDSHIYSKLNEKIKKVKNMLEAGVYDFKETQFDKDIEGVSLALNSNIDEKVKIMWSKETKKIEKKSKEYDDVNTRLNKIKSIYSEANNSLNDLLICYNAVAKGLQDYYVGSYIRSEYSTVRSKINAEYTSKRAELAEKLNNKFKADILEWEKLKEENEKLNKENKVKKLPKVDFNIDKPVKKDNPLYTPDYTNLELQEDKDLADAKIEVIKNNEQKVADKKFTEDEITYYVPLTAASSYSEISSSLNSLLNDLTVIRIKILDSDEYRVINAQIGVSGRYFVLESKSLMIDYAFTNIIRDSANSGIDNRMASVIKKYKLEGVAGMELFKDFAKLFINGGIFEIIFSDYQTLVSGVGETIATIDNVISGISYKINANNALLSAKNEFYSKYRAIFIEEEDKIKKERESLTNMKQYILVDVNKFCETNKFIYLRGKYTEEQKKDMFKIKK